MNLKRQYSEFLGFKMRLHQNGKKKSGAIRYTVISHIGEKAERNIKREARRLIKQMQNPRDRMAGYKAVNRYNAFVTGIHNYYEIATHASCDFAKIAYSIKKSITARFRTHVKRQGKHLAKHIRKRYGQSKQLRYIHNTAVAPIGYIQHRHPLFKRKAVNQYTPEGRKQIHENLSNIDSRMLAALMRHPVENRSIEYNDNRLSLYCAQKGCCYVSGVSLEIDKMHCHHKQAVSAGGNDSYMNLVLLTDDVHRLVHARREDTIQRYLGGLNLTGKQLKKLNGLRKRLELDAIEDRSTSSVSNALKEVERK